MKIKEIYLDMDGVLCNFVHGVVCEVYGNPHHVYESILESWKYPKSNLYSLIGIKEEGVMWNKVTEYGAIEFWSELLNYEWTDKLWEFCSAIAPTTILTKPNRDGLSAAGKVKWLYKWRGDKFRDYIITPKKELLASEGRVLIDDLDENIDGWKRNYNNGMCRTITFPQPWNKVHHSSKDPLKYVIGKLRDIMQGA